MAKDFDPRRLDVRRFAEEGAELSADDRLAQYRRLGAETESDIAERAVRWSARGEMRNRNHVHPEIWVHLEAGASLPLVCQRCLQPVDMPLAVDRSFRFVADEATAAAGDDEAEEDLLALSRSFDLQELIEDELLMELPLAPRHETCPVPVKMSVTDPAFELANAGRENAFSVLGRIRTSKE